MSQASRFKTQLRFQFKVLPKKLWFFNGGFSCKSFSKLHPEAKKMLSAMKDDNQAGMFAT